MQITSAVPNAVGGLSPTDQLERAVLEEFLKYYNPMANKNSFTGGHGEEQFASFLTQEYAGLLARRLDLGLGGIVE